MSFLPTQTCSLDLPQKETQQASHCEPGTVPGNEWMLPGLSTKVSYPRSRSIASRESKRSANGTCIKA